MSENIRMTLETIKLLKSQAVLSVEDIQTIIILQASLSSLLIEAMDCENERKAA